MTSILITGCNRGLGLGLVKALNKLPQPPKIIATCRDIKKAEELKQISSEHGNVHILEIDLVNMEQYEILVGKVDAIVKNEGLNVLFNNAGVAPKSTKINVVKEKDLIDTFVCNTVVPIMLTKAFLPLLKRASEFNSSRPMGINRAAVINMSSILGSIAQNDNGGLYAYRTSKTALNAATKSMSIDLQNDKILCVALHPGWVRTSMGGKNAPLDVETSTEGIVKTILNFNERNNGGFFQYDGQQLPW
ncbi:C-factor [Condylostylus longicornis]|uniref:C-factor n=1 Tax=Condylostylus longicornis TaxID=2530218 RepID=UPI00244E15CD|nr:C-factor [Condylostylus longicornis]